MIKDLLVAMGPLLRWIAIIGATALLLLLGGYAIGMVYLIVLVSQ